MNNLGSNSTPRIKLDPKRIRIVAICAIALLALAFFVLPLFQSKGSYLSYSQFDEMVANQRVESAHVDGDLVYFTLRDDETDYYTDNPASDGFRERLLLSGAQVSYATDANQMMNVFFDMFFIVFFLGGAGFALYKLIEYNQKTFKVVRNTGVTFDDVAGMDALKQELRKLVEVLKDPQSFTSKGVRPVKGIVLEGPPGNGKTLFAKALAQEAGVNFIATKGADFQSAFMSLGSRKIKSLFNKAARHKPCIVFIDEFDSIGERRNYAGTGVDKENNRIITAMLNEMDGFESRDGILVVAATNSYKSLDPALVRPGRFDLKFNVSNPDQRTREQLVAMYTKQRHLSPDLTVARVARMFDGQSCAAIETCLNGATMLAIDAPDSTITLSHIREAAKKSAITLAE